MRRCLRCGLEYSWTVGDGTRKILNEGEGKETITTCETDKPLELNVINELKRKHNRKDVQLPSAGKGACHQA